MHKKSFVICGLVCIAGIFGAFVRWLQNTTAFEETTGLDIPGATWSVVMAVYLVTVAVIFLFAVRYLGSRKKLTTGREYPGAFSGGPIICGITSFATLIFIGLGGMITVFNSLRGGLMLFDLINGIFTVITAASVFYILRNINVAKKRSGGAAFIIIVLFLCFRLIAEYKTGASDPVVWHYGIRILAISAVTLSYYYLTGYCFELPKPNRTLYFSMLGIFLSIVTFADGVSLAYNLVTLGITLALITLILLLIGNMVVADQEGTSSVADE